MALITCKECGKEVSDTASKCINCGITLKETSDFVTSLKKTPKAVLEIFTNPTKFSKKVEKNQKSWINHVILQTVVGFIAILLLLSKGLELLSGGFFSISLSDIISFELIIKMLLIIIVNVGVWSFVYSSLVYLYITQVAKIKEDYMKTVNNFIPLITFTMTMVLLLALGLYINTYLGLLIGLYSFLYLSQMTYLTIKNKYDIKKEDMLIKLIPIIIILTIGLSIFLDSKLFPMLIG